MCSVMGAEASEAPRCLSPGRVVKASADAAASARVAAARILCVSCGACHSPLRTFLRIVRERHCNFFVRDISTPIDPLKRFERPKSIETRSVVVTVLSAVAAGTTA